MDPLHRRSAAGRLAARRLVQYIDEFALGLAAEPDKGIPRIADWKLRWVGLDRGYAMMHSDHYELFAREGLPMRVLGRDLHHLIVSRR